MEYLQTQTWTENDTFCSQEENCQTQQALRTDKIHASIGSNELHLMANNDSFVQTHNYDVLAITNPQFVMSCQY